MPRFTVLPSDPAHAPTKFTARDSGGVLNVVSQIGCDEADVLQDGIYVFSVRLGASGMWTVFQRPKTVAPQSTPAYG